MNNLQKDFKQFQSDISISPPDAIEAVLLKIITEEMNPSRGFVFFKLLLIQLVIGTITLLFCPQFHLSLTNNHQIFHYFHINYGIEVCMLVCSSIFLGSGALFASFILNKREVALIRNSAYLFNIGVSMLAISSFMLLGASIYVKAGFFWFLGATLSSIFFLEFNHFFKSVFKKMLPMHS